MRRKRWLTVAGLLLLPCLALLAQETVFRVDVSLVRLLATVKDAHGALVGDLGKKDFTVYDNGVQQDITLFEHHRDPARRRDEIGSSFPQGSVPGQQPGRRRFSLQFRSRRQSRVQLYTPARAARR